MSFRDELIDRAVYAWHEAVNDRGRVRIASCAELREALGRVVDAIADVPCRVCADRDAPISERAAQLTLPLAGAHCDLRSLEPPDAICNVCGLPRDRAVMPHCRCRV